MMICWVGESKGTVFINEGDFYPTSLQVFNDTVTMTGGVIDENLALYGSRAEIFGGHISNFLVLNNNA